MANTKRFYTFPSVQALFRKIAAALPGMETLGAGGAGREDLIDVTLNPATNAAGGVPSAASCSC